MDFQNWNFFYNIYYINAIWLLKYYKIPKIKKIEKNPFKKNWNEFYRIYIYIGENGDYGSQDVNHSNLRW
mgnify:CR=1 FL=1